MALGTFVFLNTLMAHFTQIDDKCELTFVEASTYDYFVDCDECLKNRNKGESW